MSKAKEISKEEWFARRLDDFCHDSGKAPMSPSAFQMYWTAVSHLPIELIEYGFERCGSECKFFPKPIELLERCCPISPEERAIRAWPAVTQAIKSAGSYQSVDFDDPLINATIRSLGGWVSICKMPEAQFNSWVRKSFITAYVQFFMRGVSMQACRALNGKSPDTGGSRKIKMVWTGLPEHRSTIKQIEGGERILIPEKVGEQ